MAIPPAEPGRDSNSRNALQRSFGMLAYQDVCVGSGSQQQALTEGNMYWKPLACMEDTAAQKYGKQCVQLVGCQAWKSASS